MTKRITNDEFQSIFKDGQIDFEGLKQARQALLKEIVKSIKDGLKDKLQTQLDLRLSFIISQSFDENEKKIRCQEWDFFQKLIKDM